MSTIVDGTFGQSLFKAIPLRALPYFDLEIHIASSNCRILELGIRRYVFDVVALLFQQLSNNGR